MKKFIVIFILLIIAAGTAGYFGWVNIQPGTFGVAYSTLTGTVGYPLESGRIYWFWQKLIPKSFELYTVQKEPHTVEIETVHALPGSEQLKEFGSFQFTVHTTVQYRIDFEAANYLITNALFTDFENFFTSRINSQIKETISSFVLENMARYSQSDTQIRYTVLETLKEKLAKSIKETVGLFKLKDSFLTITYPEIPQVEVYNQALNKYLSYLEVVYRLKEEELGKDAENRLKMSETDIELDRWRKYGELISQYPELLKYFYIQKFSEQAEVLVLPQDEKTGFPRMLEPEESHKRYFPPEPVKPQPEAGLTLPGQESGTGLPESQPEKKIETGTPESLSEEAEALTEQREEEKTVKQKWYETLKFWKFLKKNNGEK